MCLRIQTLRHSASFSYLQLFEYIRLGPHEGHGDEEHGDRNRKTELIDDHFFDDVAEIRANDHLIEECVPIMVDRAKNGAPNQRYRPYAGPVYR